MFLCNVKTCDILTFTRVGTGLDLGLGGNVFLDQSFSVCRKTADIVVFDDHRKTLKLFKLWLPHQRKDENELRECCLPTEAQNDSSEQSGNVRRNCSII